MSDPSERTYSVRPAGVILLLVLLAAIGVASVGPSSLQLPGALVACIVGLALLSAAFPENGLRRSRKTHSTRRSEFGPRERIRDEVAHQAEQDEYMRRERERRERGASER